MARKGEAPIAEIAKDFGIGESCLRNWLHVAKVEDGRRRRLLLSRPSCGSCAPEPLLEQENEVLRRAAAHLSMANLPETDVPLVPELAADGIPSRSRAGS